MRNSLLAMLTLSLTILPLASAIADIATPTKSVEYGTSYVVTGTYNNNPKSALTLTMYDNFPFKLSIIDRIKYTFGYGVTRHLSPDHKFIGYKSAHRCEGRYSGPIKIRAEIQQLKIYEVYEDGLALKSDGLLRARNITIVHPNRDCINI